jgi:hypothetical protein
MMLALAPTALAAANPYPPAPRLVVSTDQGVYGPNVRAIITVRGCIPNQPCQLTIYPPGVGRGRAAPIAADRATTLTVQCDASGGASVVIITPNRFGVYIVEARRPDGLTAETQFTVAAVPATGGNTEWPLRAALIALAAGAVLLAVAGIRRRDRSVAPTA